MRNKEPCGVGSLGYVPRGFVTLEYERKSWWQALCRLLLLLVWYSKAHLLKTNGTSTAARLLSVGSTRPAGTAVLFDTEFALFAPIGIQVLWTENCSSTYGFGLLGHC
jgi:hypothetical protein